MNTLHCQPTGFISWNYEISGDNCPSASLVFSTFREQAVIQCPDSFDVRKDSLLRGQWSLVQNDRILASAEKPNPFTRRCTITSDRVNFEIAGANPLLRTSESLMKDRPIGTIAPAHPFTRRATIECDPVIPVVLQIFAFTLAVFAWRRAARRD